MPPRVNAVVNSHKILTLLSVQSEPMRVTEIAKATSISQSSCYNILKTLVELRWATFHPSRKTYELGPGILELAKSGWSNSKITTIAQPVLSNLSATYRCQSGLWELADGVRTLIQVAENDSIANLNLIKTGLVMPAGAGSAGKAFMVSHRHNKEKLQAEFKATDWRGKIDFPQYCAEIERARKNDFSIDRDSFFPGVTTVSSAFEDMDLGRQYCISVFLLSAAYPRKMLKSVGLKIADAKQIIRDAYLADEQTPVHIP